MDIAAAYAGLANMDPNVVGVAELWYWTVFESYVLNSAQYERWILSVLASINCNSIKVCPAISRLPIIFDRRYEYTLPLVDLIDPA